MRFKIKPTPQYGDTRTKTWFAIIPVTIDNDCRWLEMVTVKQTYTEGCLYEHGLIFSVPTWMNVKFIDKIK